MFHKSNYSRTILERSNRESSYYLKKLAVKPLIFVLFGSVIMNDEFC